MDEMRRQTDEDLKTAVESKQEETQQHAKGQIIYDTYQNRQGKAILRESRKRLKELSEKREDRNRDMKYLQERQLENYRQWDSLSRENQPIVMDGADINYRSKNGESLLHTACLHGRLHTVQLLQSKCLLLVHECDSKGRSACHSTAAGGSVDVLNFLVQEGADPLCKDVNGMNPLQYACLEGNKEMSFHLMDSYSIMLCNVGKGGYTVSHCAAYGGDIDIFKRVCKLFNLSSRVTSANQSEGDEPHCEKQADQNTLTETGETLLHMACLSGKLEMTKYLVETYPDMINVVNKYKTPLIHYAAEGGNISVLQYLIDQGLDPWCRTDTQQTLLHISCISGRLEITAYLLEKYPDMINKVDNCNRTPAHYAAYGGNVSVIQPMISQDMDLWSGTATQQILSHRSGTKSHFEIMKYLVTKYPDIISAVDNCNETTAHYAAESGNISVLQYLIGKGLDPWCRTAKQETLLHKSCVGCVLEMTKYLVETYPDMILAVDGCNRTPAHYVTRTNNVFVLQYLIDQGLDPWCRTCTQETLLHMSCIAGRLEMTQYLVEKYPEMVKEVDSCKRTAGHFAAQSSNISVLQYLIDHGLDPWCRTATQETLLHMSCISGRLETTQYLVEKYPAMIHEVDKRNETPCHYAAQSNNVSVIQYLIDNGLDPWSRTCTQETLLHVSSISGSLEMSMYLVETYPDMIKMVDKYEESPGHYAAYGGNVYVLQYLIDQGLDPWCKSVHQQALLHHSCIAGQLEMSKYLVENFPEMINEVDSSKETPVHSAAYGGNISILQYLLDQGLDPWSTSVQQQTLLHHSCFAGQLEMSKYLVEKYPAMIKEVEYCNDTPAHYAAASSNIFVLQYLIDQGLNPWCRTVTQETLLHKACIAGQLEMTRYLIQNYPDMVNEVDDGKRTPAHCAAQSGNISVLQHLIDHGMDPWCRTATQETLLHRSCIASQLEMTQYLVEKYPDMLKDVGNGQGTPGHFAAQSGNVSVLQYLTDHGLDPWCRTATQETLLHKSCIAGQLEMTQYLVEKFPDMMKEVEHCNGTPGHFAAQSNNITVLQYLIDQGLDPRCRTSTNETLLHKSCIAGQLEMAQYLVDKYPEMINETDNRKETPGHYAALSSNVSVLKYLIDHGLDPWCRTATQETLLHKACIARHLEITKYVVQKYPDMISQVYDCKPTPANGPVVRCNVSVLQNLIDQGLDARCKTATHETLLPLLYFAYQLEMTYYLVETYPDMIREVNNCNATPGHYAAQSGNVSVLQYLIDKGLNPWCRTDTQETLLHKACIAGKLQMTKYLTEKYPDMINKVDKRKRTPAHYAAQSNSISVLQYLLDQGLDPWCKTATYETLLHKACICGQLEMTHFLVEKYPGMINELDNCQGTPGHYAAQSSNILVLQHLIGQGLNPWSRTASEETLLHKSCIAGKLEMTQYLVEKYPDMINKVDICKGTPLHYAAQSSNILVLQHLIGQGLNPWSRTASEETLLHKSCIAGKLEMTQYLIQKYPDMINKVDSNKNTPGHYAAIGGYISVLQYLTDQGLDPWCRTVTQETLLHKACIAGKLEMTQYLVETYPDMINEIDMRKRTTGHDAALGRNISILQYLIGKGLDPWCRTATQETLLHISCIAGQLEMSIYLVETYPDMIKQVDNCNRTPGHYAAQNGNVSLLQYLIRQGLDPWCRATTQETLLHKSSKAGKLEMSRYLVEKYPDMINNVDSSKGTPAHYAAQSSNVSVLQYLIDQGLDPWCRTATHQTLLHMSCIAGQLKMTHYLVTKYPLMMHFIMFDNCLKSPAHNAAQSGNVSVLQYLIDHGVDPWCRTVTQETLLHRSCIAGKLEMSKYLVEKYPVMMNKLDNCKRTPGHYAAQSSNVSLLQYLIDQGMDPWCRTAEQETLLHMASIAGQLEMTQYLVEKYPDMINKVSSCGKSLATYAAQSGNVSVLQYLIDQGLDPWCRTNTQETLLHISCIAGKLEMTQYLLEKYPDMINEVNNCQETPGHYAALKGYVSILKLLINKGLDPWCRTATQETLLHRSSNAGQVEMSKYLVEKYPDMINEVDNCNRTSGHCAAQSGNVSLLHYLIDAGLDPWRRTATQQTLLHIALTAARIKVVKYLVERYPTMISMVQFNMHL